MLWRNFSGVAALAVVHAQPTTHKAYINPRRSMLEVISAPVLPGTAAEIFATIKNNGSTDLNLLKADTILDETLPVQRIIVSDESGKLFCDKYGDFHRLEKSGTYTVVAEGVVPAALAPFTKFLHPAIAFKSNVVNIDVDADHAAAELLVTAALEERTNLQPGCNETTLNASPKALTNCQALALAGAADAADHHPSGSLSISAKTLQKPVTS
ncbi:neutral protease 2 [Colletotrichum incanum]|uniref:Neutral protease 2 n=1 Tax=Colletotrichum incanum TaxID=1573173 RepID=A0A167E8H6_COLIC|nr:neutral protease 2 [Colletotrichum incanum]